MLRILLLHPFGPALSNDWNHRLRRQAELMSQRCDLKAVGLKHGDDWPHRIKDAISGFKPDVAYVNGYLVAFEALKVFGRVVYDMGSWKTRNVLVDECKITYKEMREMSVEELKKKVNRKNSDDFKKEDQILQKVKAIIIWESEEAELVERIHNVKVNQTSMMFYDLPEPIRWEDKEDYVIAISAKWGERQKNHRLISHLNGGLENKKYYIHSVGHSGNSERFVEHGRLMDRVNRSRVVFCPYICGGIGVVNEGLKLGCNVVVGDWYSYRTYTNEEITISSKGDVKDNAKDCIRMAMERYYPPKRELPKEEEQLNKILKICEQVANK